MNDYDFRSYSSRLKSLLLDVIPANEFKFKETYVQEDILEDTLTSLTDNSVNINISSIDFEEYVGIATAQVSVVSIGSNTISYMENAMSLVNAISVKLKQEKFVDVSNISPNHNGDRRIFTISLTLDS
jgi:hypothetical protein